MDQLNALEDEHTRGFRVYVVSMESSLSFDRLLSYYEFRLASYGDVSVEPFFCTGNAGMRCVRLTCDADMGYGEARLTETEGRTLVTVSSAVPTRGRPYYEALRSALERRTALEEQAISTLADVALPLPLMLPQGARVQEVLCDVSGPSTERHLLVGLDLAVPASADSVEGFYTRSLSEVAGEPRHASSDEYSIGDLTIRERKLHFRARPSSATVVVLGATGESKTADQGGRPEWTVVELVVAVPLPARAASGPETQDMGTSEVMPTQ